MIPIINTEYNRMISGKIYTIRYKLDPSYIYVGSTQQPLSKRWGDHKMYIKNMNKTGLIYKTIRDTNDIGNWYIELYENYECDTKEQLHRREGEVIREIATLNYVIAGRTNAERYIDKKDIKLEYAKQYRENNRDLIRERDKAFYEANKEKIIQKKKEYRANKKIGM